MSKYILTKEQMANSLINLGAVPVSMKSMLMHSNKSRILKDFQEKIKPECRSLIKQMSFCKNGNINFEQVKREFPNPLREMIVETVSINKKEINPQPINHIEPVKIKREKSISAKKKALAKKEPRPQYEIDYLIKKINEVFS